MDLGRHCTTDKSHSGSVGDEDDEEHRGKNAANYDEKHIVKMNELDEDGNKMICISSVTSVSDIHKNEKDVDKDFLVRNLRHEDSTHLEAGLSNNEICEEDNGHNLAKSGCGGIAKKATQRGPTLRELLQMPADCGHPPRVVSQSKQQEHSEHQEQHQLAKQKAVPKQFRWPWGNLKTKGLSWSCLSIPEDTLNKPQTKKKNGVFGKVTNSAERTKLLKASGHIG